MLKHTVIFAVVAGLVLAMAPAVHAGLVGQLGLDGAWFLANPINPGTAAPWQAGDTYQLAFTTTSLTIASLDPPGIYANIATFDAIVQADADAAGIGATQGVRNRA